MQRGLFHRLRHTLAGGSLGLLLLPSGGLTVSHAGLFGIKPDQPQTSAQAYYVRGINALAKGDLKEANTAFMESLRLDPGLIGSLLGLAEIALKQRRTEEVRKLLQKAVTLSPENAFAQRAWGRYLYSQKNFDEAEKAFKKAIELNPEDISSHVNLGDLYLYGLRKPKKAVKAYRSALSVDPRNAGARFALGRALVSIGQIEEAKTNLQEAGRMAPSNPLPFVALGQLYASRKELDKALKAFGMAIKAQPKYIDAYLARGDTFLLRGNYKKALADFLAVLQIAPKFAPAYIKIGMVHQENKRLDQATKAYLKAIKLDNKQVIAYNNLAWLATERRADLDRALIWAQKAVELAPNTPTFKDTLGWVHRARGDLTKAVSVLEQAITLKPERAEIFYHLGVLYAETGKAKEAVGALKKAITLQKDFDGADDARQRLADETKKLSNIPGGDPLISYSKKTYLVMGLVLIVGIAGYMLARARGRLKLRKS